MVYILPHACNDSLWSKKALLLLLLLLLLCMQCFIAYPFWMTELLNLRTAFASIIVSTLLRPPLRDWLLVVGRVWATKWENHGCETFSAPLETGSNFSSPHPSPFSMASTFSATTLFAGIKCHLLPTVLQPHLPLARNY